MKQREKKKHGDNANDQNAGAGAGAVADVVGGDAGASEPSTVVTSVVSKNSNQNNNDHALRQQQRQQEVEEAQLRLDWAYGHGFVVYYLRILMGISSCLIYADVRKSDMMTSYIIKGVTTQSRSTRLSRRTRHHLHQ